jgi:hypothetical protein
METAPEYAAGAAGAAAGVRGEASSSGRQSAAGTQRTSGSIASGSQAAGITRGGFDCKPGVLQIPWSDYAGPCMPKFTGDNGGATSRGVTRETITVARRNFEQASQFSPIIAAAGVASEEVYKAVRQVFVDWFNKVFELYGRKVNFVDFTASQQSSDVEEAQSRGREGACIDATKVANEIKAFAAAESGWGPYGECLAERKVIHFAAGPYFPETWYRKHHPYIYHVIMECERIVLQQSEYMGKRLLGRKARWAGDPLMQSQVRKFGMYVPNNDEYQHCVKIFEDDFKARYGGTLASRYNYTLDVSRFPDEATRGIVQFKSAGVTTVLNNCDPYSTIFMMSAASAQAFFPEWYIIGVAGQDADTVAQLYDQRQADGHLFGMSQLSDQSEIWGPASEPGATYKRITGKDIPDGTDGSYFGLLQIYSFLQSAGPVLTPDTMEKGVHALPRMGVKGKGIGAVSYATGPDGTVATGPDHTGVEDSREVYWCSKCISKTNGKEGAYLVTYGGRRFVNGQWSQEEPPVYPTK